MKLKDAGCIYFETLKNLDVEALLFFKNAFEFHELVIKMERGDTIDFERLKVLSTMILSQPEPEAFSSLQIKMEFVAKVCLDEK